MKLIATIGLLVVILVPGVAHATPLVATWGWIGLYGVDTWADFGGEEFSVFVSQPSSFISNPFTIAIGMNGMDGDGGLIHLYFGWGEVYGAICSSYALGIGETCGSMTLAYDPLATLPAPFTLTGHLNVGDGFDFVGQGTVRAGTPNPYPWLRYTVPEPSTLLLVIASLGALGALHGTRRGASR